MRLQDFIAADSVPDIDVESTTTWEARLGFRPFQLMPAKLDRPLIGSGISSNRWDTLQPSSVLGSGGFSIGRRSGNATGHYSS